jgi:hypothetical protein
VTRKTITIRSLGQRKLGRYCGIARRSGKAKRAKGQRILDPWGRLAYGGYRQRKWISRMAELASSLKSKLDWSKLLGFDQATRSESAAGAQRLTDPRLAKLGGKVGTKSGMRLAR